MGTSRIRRSEEFDFAIEAVDYCRDLLSIFVLSPLIIYRRAHKRRLGLSQRVVTGLVC